MLTIKGHDEILERFAVWHHRDRLASAYLFVGTDGVGKHHFAKYLAAFLLCDQPADPSQLKACGTCPACQQVRAETHPDLLQISRPPEKNVIPVKLLIGENETRMKEGLCHDIALKSYSGGRKIAIINDADFLNQEGANCLLKTLEEPPPKSLIILISNSEHRQLPTIRSRCQIIRFKPLPIEAIKEILTEQLPDESAELEDLAFASQGSLSLAMQLTREDVAEFRSAWLNQLATLDPGQDNFADAINSFVDAAGKDSATKRNRLRLVCDFSMHFYRNLMVALSDQPIQCDSTLQQAIETALSRSQGKADNIADCIDRCLINYGHIAANANQHTLIECWLSDLGRICRGEKLELVG